MQWLRFARLAVCVGLLGVWACGDDEAPPNTTKPTRDAGDEFECVDKDSDGFGTYCDDGNDCDDDDPEVTDECIRCARVREGCKCEPGTEPLGCDPPDKKADGGILVCSEGTRYCRDGSWGICEVIGDYVFVPNR
jgi:hypothetical protein